MTSKQPANELVNILLVDDKPSNLVALESFLSLPGYKLVTANSGLQALRRLEEDDFAVILTDVMMPTMNGFELASRIRGMQRLRGIPIIFLTAMASEVTDVFRGYEVGAVDYLQKPLEPEVVKAKVAVFVQLYRHERLIRRHAEELLESARREQMFKVLELRRQAAAQRRRIKSVLQENARKRELEGLQSLQLDVAHILAEAHSVADAVPKVLGVVAEKFGWHWGALWELHGTTLQLKAAHWPASSLPMSAFAAVCRDTFLLRGQDVPGQVWEQCTPVWIAEGGVPVDSPRFAGAAELDPHGIVAIPLLLGAEFAAVLEFFAPIGAESKMAFATIVDIGARLAWYMQRKRGEVVLRESEEKYRLLVNAIEDYAIFIVSPDGVVTSWNDGARRLYGYEAEEIIGKNVATLFPQAAAQTGLPQHALNLARSDGRFYDEAIRVRRDGSQFWASVTLTVLRDGSGALRGFAKTSCDITNRKQAQEALKQSYEVVNIEVRERTKQLEAVNAELSIEVTERQRVEKLLLAKQEEIQAAKEAAEAASVAKTAFLANMSHEIRTPLGAVLGFSELLLTPDQAESERANCAEGIRRNGEILLSVINDILDLSKVEAGKLDIEKVTLPLGEVIQDIRLLLNLKGSEKGLKVAVVNKGPVPVSVTTDPLRLRQVLANLIGNAAKFTDQGAITVTISRVDSADGKGTLGFAVQDTGRGVSDEQVGRLFEAFSQADSSTTRRYGGTGLGLILSKNLAIELGGDVVLSQSTPGHGSTFTLTIDVGEAAWTETREYLAEPEPVVSSRGVGPPVSFGNLHVLVVDDAPENRFLFSRMLRSVGATADMAQDGREGVQKALSGSYGLVLMDIQMPGMDGYDALRSLRDAGYRGAIVALTAHAMAEERRRCLSSGFDGHLSKPVRRLALMQCLAEFGRQNVTGRLLHGLKVLVVSDSEDAYSLIAKVLAQGGAVVQTATTVDEALVAVTDAKPDALLCDFSSLTTDGISLIQALRSYERSGKWPRSPSLPALALAASATTPEDHSLALAEGYQGVLTKPVDREDLVKALARLGNGRHTASFRRGATALADGAPVF